MKTRSNKLKKNWNWIIWGVFGLMFLVLIIIQWDDFVRGLTGQKF